MGPVDFPPNIPRTVDVRPHPHIGLSTVTYLFDGEIMHRDSVGSEEAIHPGEVNWMTAGRGITHSERFERARAQGDALHGIQSWVALPREHEETEPGFIHYGRDVLPVFEEPGVFMRLLAGEAFGASSGVHTHSPLFYLHWQLATGSRVQLPSAYTERAAYVVAGLVSVGAERYGTAYRHRAADGSFTGAPLPVDLAANAASLGMDVLRAKTVGELRTALAAARGSDRPTCVYVETDPTPTAPPAEAWWDVPVAETATRESAVQAREEYDRQVADRRRHL
jgi:hypothetical protein